MPIQIPLLSCNDSELDQRACQLLERLQDRGYPGLLANRGISTPRSISHEELLILVAAALEETALDNSRVVKCVREFLERDFGEELAMLPQDTAKRARR